MYSLVIVDCQSDRQPGSIGNDKRIAELIRVLGNSISNIVVTLACHRPNSGVSNPGLPVEHSEASGLVPEIADMIKQPSVIGYDVLDMWHGMPYKEFEKIVSTMTSPMQHKWLIVGEYAFMEEKMAMWRSVMANTAPYAIPEMLFLKDMITCPDVMIGGGLEMTNSWAVFKRPFLLKGLPLQFMPDPTRGSPMHPIPEHTEALFLAVAHWQHRLAQLEDLCFHIKAETNDAGVDDHDEHVRPTLVSYISNYPDIPPLENPYGAMLQPGRGVLPMLGPNHTVAAMFIYNESSMIISYDMEYAPHMPAKTNENIDLEALWEKATPGMEFPECSTNVAYCVYEGYLPHHYNTKHAWTEITVVCVFLKSPPPFQSRIGHMEQYWIDSLYHPFRIKQHIATQLALVKDWFANRTLDELLKVVTPEVATCIQALGFEGGGDLVDWYNSQEPMHTYVERLAKNTPVSINNMLFDVDEIANTSELSNKAYELGLLNSVVIRCDAFKKELDVLFGKRFMSPNEIKVYRAVLAMRLDGTSMTGANKEEKKIFTPLHKALFPNMQVPVVPMLLRKSVEEESEEEEEDNVSVVRTATPVDDQDENTDSNVSEDENVIEAMEGMKKLSIEMKNEVSSQESSSEHEDEAEGEPSQESSSEHEEDEEEEKDEVEGDPSQESSSEYEEEAEESTSSSESEDEEEESDHDDEPDKTAIVAKEEGESRQEEEEEEDGLSIASHSSSKKSEDSESEQEKD